MKLVVLYERLPMGNSVRDEVYRELKRALAGAAGEKRTKELLERELDLEGKFSIYHGLSLPYKNGYTEVDFLLVHAHLISVMEVKNMVGDFYFDSANFQFHRIIEGRTEGMRNPETQLHRAVKASEKFFSRKVHGTIVLSSRSGRVAVPPKLYPIIALDYLPFHLEKLVDPKLSLNLDEFEVLLRRSRGHYNGPELLKKHKLTRESLEAGVRCLGCGRISCEWIDRKWRCGRCGGVSSNAHEFALQEYAVLFGLELPTTFAYKWLRVEDKYILYRLLEKSTTKSNKRGIRYIKENRDALIEYFQQIYS
ncbi:nuclease-related domain-containing protein [Planococcus sp. CAU13]|uniref:nuclease-related domain-containing protein n=1 Tax=Planococcus sp. CAU13 TaxID=1541197 RepID=UPI001F1F764F|nr:nuclease-related domain-containing protein [Planococcus sp. CAU13]